MLLSFLPSLPSGSLLVAIVSCVALALALSLLFRATAKEPPLSPEYKRKVRDVARLSLQSIHAGEQDKNPALACTHYAVGLAYLDAGLMLADEPSVDKMLGTGARALRESVARKHRQALKSMFRSCPPLSRGDTDLKLPGWLGEDHLADAK